MKIKINQDEDKTIIFNEAGKVIFILDKKMTKGKNITKIIKMMFKNVEIIED